LTTVLTSGNAEAEGCLDPATLIKQTGVAQLELLTRGTTPPNPAELCHSERFKRLLQQLEQRYDLLVIDSPPIAAVTDAVVISNSSDGTVLVARAGQTAKGLLKEAHRRLVDVGAPLLGCVINGLDALGPRYAYRYAARYAPDADQADVLADRR
jgi:capsular exopolysaccharide synthesis family protein